MITGIHSLYEMVGVSECVLIGIGEELAITQQEIEVTECYKKYIEKGGLQSEGYRWLKEYIIADYTSTAVMNRQLKAYQNLYDLVKDKNYFIVTLNQDSFLTKAGFPADRIVSPCGSYRRMQCSGCKNIWDSEETVKTIINDVRNEKKPLVEIKKPICSTCHAVAELNIASKKEYIEEGYLKQWQKYTNWLSYTLNKKLCVMELGVGFQYPSVIRWPFEKIVFFNQKSQFIRVHGKLAQVSEEFASKENIYTIHENALNFLFN